MQRVVTPNQLFKSQRPPSGVTVDETRVVPTMLGPPASWVRVRCDYANIDLPTALLEDLCGLGVADWHTEQQRLGTIAAGRARKLLAAASQQQPLLAPVPAEIGHLLVLLLENRAAYAHHALDGSVISELEIRYVGQRLAPTAGFGRIIVSEAHVGLPLLISDWWVA